MPSPPDSELLILVDGRDRAHGCLSKARCHDGEGVLHRAFSVFLRRPDGRWLLQRRSRHKRLWPGYWSNSCCSHPRAGERTAAAARRRVREELSVACALRRLYGFEYRARFRDRGSEHEYCHVFVGELTEIELAALAPAPREIGALKWVSTRQLDAWVRRPRARLSPWLRLEWPLVRTNDSRRSSTR